VLDDGTASDLSAELLTAQARPVGELDVWWGDGARILMCDQLKPVGFIDVPSKPSESLNAIEPSPPMAAAGSRHTLRFFAKPVYSNDNAAAVGRSQPHPGARRCHPKSVFWRT
jgi:hypothetical protein